MSERKLYSVVVTSSLSGEMFGTVVEADWYEMVTSDHYVVFNFYVNNGEGLSTMVSSCVNPVSVSDQTYLKEYHPKDDGNDQDEDGGGSDFGGGLFGGMPWKT